MLSMGQLKTTEMFFDDLRRFAEKFPDRRVAYLDDDDDLFYVNEIEWDDDILYVCRRRSSENEDFTVAEFLEEEPSSDSDVVVIYWGYDEEGEERTFAMGDDGVFFEYEDDGEDIIAFRLGGLVEEERAEYEEGDTIITVGDFINELLPVVKENPNYTVCYSYGNGDYGYIYDLIVDHEDATASLETDCYDNIEPWSVERILEELKEVDGSNKLLVDGYRIMVEDNPRIFNYDEGDDFYYIWVDN